MFFQIDPADGVPIFDQVVRQVKFAVARGVALLESGLPPTDPYVCLAEIVTTSGVRSFKVTFETAGAGNWSVNAVPAEDGESFDPIPVIFP